MCEKLCEPPDPTACRSTFGSSWGNGFLCDVISLSHETRLSGSVVLDRSDPSLTAVGWSCRLTTSFVGLIWVWLCVNTLRFRLRVVVQTKQPHVAVSGSGPLPFWAGSDHKGWNWIFRCLYQHEVSCNGETLSCNSNIRNIFRMNSEIISGYFNRMVIFFCSFHSFTFIEGHFGCFGLL